MAAPTSIPTVQANGTPESPPPSSRRRLFHRMPSAPLPSSSTSAEFEARPSPLPTRTTESLRSCLSSNRLRALAEVAAQMDDIESTPSNKPRALHRKVSFGHVHIREHPRVLGDHPSVSSGPALALGWYCDDPEQCSDSRTITHCLEEYEASQSSTRESRRTLAPLPRHQRQLILLRQAGVSLTDMAVAAREAARIRESRRQARKKEKQSRSIWKELRRTVSADFLGLAPSSSTEESSLQVRKSKKRQLNTHSEPIRLPPAPTTADDLRACEEAALAERVRQQHEVAYWQDLYRSQQQQQPQGLSHAASEPGFCMRQDTIVSESSSDEMNEMGNQESESDGPLVF